MLFKEIIELLFLLFCLFLTLKLDFFNKLELIDEEYLENIANNIEPVFKYGKQEIKRLTNIDKNYFQRKMKKRGTICVSNMKMEFGNKKESIFDL